LIERVAAAGSLGSNHGGELGGLKTSRERQVEQRLDLVRVQS
jgi:hypothetical protein